jgi:hypothetical protein
VSASVLDTRWTEPLAPIHQAVLSDALGQQISLLCTVVALAATAEERDAALWRMYVAEQLKTDLEEHRP